MPNPRRVLKAALLEAGGIVRGLAGKVGYRLKSPANLVTVADKRSESLILRRVLKVFPGHGFWSEERAPRWKTSGPLWVIDPLDGTTNFAHTYPVSGISVGLFDGGKVVLGGVYDPFRRELFLAERGKGATLNGRPIRVSRVERLSESLLVTGFPYDRAGKASYYIRFYQAFLSRCHDIRRSGAASIDMAWAACGRVDAFWEFKLHPWDVAAGRLLVEEAGGKVTDFEDQPWGDIKRYGRQTLASNGRIHDQVLQVVRRYL